MINHRVCGVSVNPSINPSINQSINQYNSVLTSYDKSFTSSVHFQLPCFSFHIHKHISLLLLFYSSLQLCCAVFFNAVTLNDDETEMSWISIVEELYHNIRSLCTIFSFTFYTGRTQRKIRLGVKMDFKPQLFQLSSS